MENNPNKQKPKRVELTNSYRLSARNSGVKRKACIHLACRLSWLERSNDRPLQLFLPGRQFKLQLLSSLRRRGQVAQNASRDLPSYVISFKGKSSVYEYELDADRKLGW